MENRPDANSWSKVDFRHFRGRRLSGPIRVVGQMGCYRQEPIGMHSTVRRRVSGIKILERVDLNGALRICP
jgi:hypothetical protein